MPWSMYHRLIEEPRDSGIPIDGDISFGMYAKPLEAPLLVDRLRLAKDRLSDVPNIAYSNGKRHGRAREWRAP